MPYVETLPSGRHRGVVRLEDGRKRSRTFDYLFEAEAWAESAAGRLEEIARPTLDKGSQVRRRRVPTVAAHAAAWHVRRAGLLTRATVGFYGVAVRALADHAIGAAPLDVLRRSDVEQWMTDQVLAGVGVPTIRARLKVLRMVCRDALSEGLTDRDPTDGVRIPTAPIRAERVLTAGEDRALVDQLDADALGFVLLGLDAGLRWSEVAGIPVDAINLEAGYLVVRQVVERDGTVRAYPKGHRSRVVPLTDRTVAALAPLVARARLRRGAAGLVFVRSTGRPLDYWDHRRDVWRPAVRAAGLKPAPRFHDLRHTYGSRLAGAGVPRAEIAVLMGHADERTTGRYVHAGDDGRRAELVRAALAG